MPKGKGTKRSETATAESDNGEAAGVGPTVDLSAYRTEPAETSTPAESPQAKERARRPRVEWQALAGIPGLTYIDGWEDVNDSFGPYTGSVVRIPKVGKNPAVEVVALTGANTTAGRAIHAHLQSVDYEDDGSLSPTSVSAKLRPTKPRPDPVTGKMRQGRPRVVVTFGD